MKQIRIAALGAALILSASAVAEAQQPSGQRGRPEARERPGMRQGQDRSQMLFRGITLTDEQREQIRSIRERHREQMMEQRRQMTGARAEARPRPADSAARAETRARRVERARARSTPADSAARAEMRDRMAERARIRAEPVDSAARARMRAEMEARAEQHRAELRAVLTPEQAVIFDRNVAEMRERMQRREGERATPGVRHGQRPPRGR